MIKTGHAVARTPSQTGQKRLCHHDVSLRSLLRTARNSEKHRPALLFFDMPSGHQPRISGAYDASRADNSMEKQQKQRQPPPGPPILRV
jgi:hypothetical protein